MRIKALKPLIHPDTNQIYGVGEEVTVTKEKGEILVARGAATEVVAQENKANKEQNK